MQKSKTIRFTEKNLDQYEMVINRLAARGPIVAGAKPYIGMFVDGELVSCVWKSRYHEICYVTYSKYRNNGYLTRLVRCIRRDVDRGLFKIATANPINDTSEHVLKKCGFSPRKRDNSTYEYRRKK